MCQAWASSRLCLSGTSSSFDSTVPPHFPDVSSLDRPSEWILDCLRDVAGRPRGTEGAVGCCDVDWGEFEVGIVETRREGGRVDGMELRAAPPSGGGRVLPRSISADRSRASVRVRAHLSLCASLALLAPVLAAVSLNSSILGSALVPSSLCQSVQYLDINTLNCKTCPTNMELSGAGGRTNPFLPQFPQLQLTRTYSLSLSLQAGIFLRYDHQDMLGVPSEPGSRYVICDPSKLNLFAARSRRSSTFTVDRSPLTGAYLAQFTCQLCPPGSFPDANAEKCLSCDDPRTMFSSLAGSSYSCQCDIGFSAAPQGPFCLTPAQTTSLATSFPSSSRYSTVTFSFLLPATSAPVSFSSWTFSRIFPGAAARCRAYAGSFTSLGSAAVTDGITSGPESCQALANLCVLQMYDQASDACGAYFDAARVARATVGSGSGTGVQGMGENGNTDWPPGLPFLFYGYFTGTKAATFASATVGTSFGWGHGQTPNMTIIAAKYLLNGTFLGYEEFVDQIQLCPRPPTQSRSFLTMGTAYNNTCAADLHQLVADKLESWSSTGGMRFYDLYILQSDSSLLPLPLLIANSPSNLYADPASRVLTRRLFSLDVASGVDAMGSLKYIRFIKRVVLRMNATSEPGKVTVPVLEVEYGEREVAAVNEGDGSQVSMPLVSFSSFPSQPLDALWQNLFVAVGMLGVLAAGLWLYQSYGWSKRNFVGAGGAAMDLRYIFRSLLLLCGVLGPLLSILTFTISVYFAIFFKAQGTAYAWLPWNAQDVAGVKLAVMVAAIMEIVHIVDRMVPQCTATVFFLDWEKPRSTTPQATSGAQSQTLADTGRVPMWRTIVCARAWNDLSTYRRARVDVSLVALAVMLYGAGLSKWATAAPSGNEPAGDVGVRHPMLVFILDGGVYALIVLVQCLYHHLIHSRFIRHPPLHFVDLLSVCNVSLVVLFERYTGHYVHGRSPHATAELDGQGIGEALKREENDLAPSRSLPGSSCQVFQVHLTERFRATWDQIWRGVELDRERGGAGVGSGKAGVKNGTKSMAARMGRRALGEGGAEAVRDMNRFLGAWVEQNVKEFPYVVRHKTYLERWFVTAPDLTQGCVWFEDPSSLSFTSTTLLGLEPHLILLYILLLVYLDLEIGAPWGGIVGVAFVEWIVSGVRKAFGRWAVAKSGVGGGVAVL
ncbi:hypothetical protein M427DRAFT_141962 [Gonapodya prolifera JEL478]|uniref:Meckelin n=1 Tax=Gonapodya prolifera (strain JEL478) TaxID=1344416 RepID=A0A139B0P8_GONPJ|nr:hypothetical protein M427DRAFT_141962 [Gonapodya prolifera JEL478]|eukprot:KXS22554.1 hypothetical protein M427DRAFT_141962 [Gonapodya prolifera JEL478]